MMNKQGYLMSKKEQTYDFILKFLGFFFNNIKKSFADYSALLLANVVFS